MLTPEAESAPPCSAPSRQYLLLNALLAALLFAGALLIRWNAARGDLWLDEADYAAAARRGFQLNRWDRSDNTRDPDRIVRYRHYHPPGTAYLVLTTQPARPTDREMRLPFALIGSLSVVLVFLCGLRLYGGSRSPAAACAAILLFTPVDIRAGSHALPWAGIVCLLLLLFWSLLLARGTRSSGWLVMAGGSLGAMFVISEYFFPALLAVACALPFLLGGVPREVSARRKIVISAAAGGLMAVVIALALWPAGVQGGVVRTMRHYVAMSGDAWPVMLLGRRYERAPKWAYLYWMVRFYPAFALCYALGATVAVRQVWYRRITAEQGMLLAFTGVVMLVVHRAHIIGPAYAVPALPFLTLLGGLFFTALLRRGRLPAWSLMAAFCLACAFIPTRWDVLNMDRRSRISRWPMAARFLAARWRPGDMMLAPAFGSAARWYLLHQPPQHLKEWQVQALPEGGADRRLLQEIAEGNYRFIAVGSLFDDRPAIDPRIDRMVRQWLRIWRSDEEGTGPSRLVLYERPPGVSRRHPLPIPSDKESPSEVVSPYEAGRRPAK